MDGQTYLDQISQSNRRTTQLPGIFKSKIFKLVAVAIAAFILLFIFGSFLGNDKTDTKTELYRFNEHLNTVSTNIETYRPSLKSSSLRSSSASLASIISGAIKDLASYLGDEEGNVETPEAIVTSESELSQKLNDDLFAAKINGLLDRVFARKIMGEITNLTNSAENLYNQTKDESLQTVLANFWDSLNTLYANFNNYSE